MNGDSIWKRMWKASDIHLILYLWSLILWIDNVAALFSMTEESGKQAMFFILFLHTWVEVFWSVQEYWFCYYRYYMNHKSYWLLRTLQASMKRAANRMVKEQKRNGSKTDALSVRYSFIVMDSFLSNQINLLSESDCRRKRVLDELTEEIRDWHDKAIPGDENEMYAGQNLAVQEALKIIEEHRKERV